MAVLCGAAGVWKHLGLRRRCPDRQGYSWTFVGSPSTPPASQSQTVACPRILSRLRRPWFRRSQDLAPWSLQGPCVDLGGAGVPPALGSPASRRADGQQHRVKQHSKSTESTGSRAQGQEHRVLLLAHGLETCCSSPKLGNPVARRKVQNPTSLVTPVPDLTPVPQSRRSASAACSRLVRVVGVGRGSRARNKGPEKQRVWIFPFSSELGSKAKEKASPHSLTRLCLRPTRHGTVGRSKAALWEHRPRPLFQTRLYLVHPWSRRRDFPGPRASARRHRGEGAAPTGLTPPKI